MFIIYLDYYSSCQQAVNEMRLTVLRMVQQVFGTKAVILLHEQAHADVSGIDLTKMTGLDLSLYLVSFHLAVVVFCWFHWLPLFLWLITYCVVCG